MMRRGISHDPAVTIETQSTQGAWPPRQKAAAFRTDLCEGPALMDRGRSYRCQGTGPLCDQEKEGLLLTGAGLPQAWAGLLLTEGRGGSLPPALRQSGRKGRGLNPGEQPGPGAESRAPSGVGARTGRARGRALPRPALLSPTPCSRPLGRAPRLTPPHTLDPPRGLRSSEAV